MAMDTGKNECRLDDRWLKEMHQKWKEAGRVAPPDKVGALLDEAVREWQTLTAAMQGDEKAWNALYAKYYQHAYSITRCIVPNDETVEDVALECLTDIFRNRADLKPERGFVRLVSRMAKLRSLSAAQRRKGAQDISLEAALEENDGVSLPLTEDTDDPQELVERDATAAIVRAEVNKLPEEYRVVVQLCFFGECSLSEAGKELGLGKDQVRYLLDKAKELLREPLAKQLGFDADINGGDES